MDYVTINYDAIVAFTDLAVCLAVADQNVWLPFSTIRDVDSRDHLDETDGSVEITEWIAIDKGLV